MQLPIFLLEVWQDLQRKELLPIKLTYALLMAATYSLYPFLTVHLRSLGVTAGETALIYAFIPIVAFVAPPFVGAVADKFGHVKIIFIVTCILNIAVGNSLMFVPNTKTRNPYEVPLAWSLSCPHRRYQRAEAKLQDIDIPCTLRSTTKGTNVTFRISRCWKSCFSETLSTSEQRICFEGEKLANDFCLDLEFGKTKKNKMSFINLKPLINLNNDLLANDTFFDFSSIEINGYNYSGLFCNPLKDFQCWTSCTGYLSGEELCQDIKEHNALTFWLYLAIRLMWAILSSSTYVLFEAITLEAVKIYNADYSHQKLLGTLAMCIFSPLTGTLIDYTSKSKDQPNYNVAFYIYSICGLFMVIVMPFFKMEFKMPTQTLCRDVKILLSNADFNIFILMMFLTGSLWGYLESFLFWFLQEMDATESLMGLTVTVGALSGIPILIFAGMILKKVGHIEVFILAFFLYGVRFYGYSMLQNPYLSLPLESLEAFTNSLQSVSAATYTAKLAPPSILASAQGIVTGMQYGIGKGAGSLAGGYLMSCFGTRKSFQIMGTTSIITGIIYIIIYIFYLKRQRRSSINDFANKDSNDNECSITGTPQLPNNERQLNVKYNFKQTRNKVKNKTDTNTFHLKIISVNGKQNSAFEPDLVRCLK